MLASVRTRAVANAPVAGAVRSMSIFGSSAPKQPSLDVPFPGTPEVDPKPRSGEAQSTVLPNGLRVVTADRGETATKFGVFVGAGSRFETDETHGVTQVLQHMAFKSTATRTAVRLVREAQDNGATLGHSLTRDVLSYTGEGPRTAARDTFFSVAETVADPKLRDWEVAEAVGEARMTEARRAANVEEALTDALYAAAFYDDSPLGRSLGIPSWQGAIQYDDLLAYRDRVLVGGNVVVAATGIEHDEAVKMADAFFADVPAGARPEMERQAYAGGESRARSPGGTAVVRVAFSGAGRDSSDFAAVRVLQAALTGSGDVIKTPGSGLQSRVGAQVSGHAGGVLRARVFLFSHEDVSLFGAHLLVSAGEAGEATRRTVDAMRGAAQGEVSADELARAQAIAKQAVLATGIGAEGLGRGVLLSGDVGVSAQLAAIDKVTAGDVKRVAEGLATQRPTLASAGNVKNVPRVDAL